MANGRISTYRKKLWRMLTAGVAPRILTVILIVFLPVCAGTLATVNMVLKEAAGEVSRSRQRELDASMESLEERITGIDPDMDYFVSEFGLELSTHADNADIVPYQMLQRLDRVLARTELSGFVYLYDGRKDRGYWKNQMQGGTVRELEERKARLEPDVCRLAEGCGPAELDGVDWIVKSFSYANYRVAFCFRSRTTSCCSFLPMQGSARSIISWRAGQNSFWMTGAFCMRTGSGNV